MITHNQMVQFVAVARNQSITKASEELFIAQPAISATIKKMETELSVDLFFYENKQLRLTSAGEKIFKLVSEILDKTNQLITFSEVSENSTQSRGKTFSYYAASSIHDYITPQLQLFDIFPYMNFSTYNCSSLENFFVAAANSENVFGIFFIPDSVLESIPSIFPGFSFEIITSVQSTLITSYKNTSPITKKNSVTLDEVAKLPLIRCFGSNLAIQENLYDTQFSYCMDVANAQYVSVILNKRPELYCLGTNIFLSVESKKSISIPIIDAPLINLVLITKNNEENDDVFSRLSTILRSLYMH